MTIFFTSIVPNYIAKARVLCKTLKAHNPGAFFVLGLCDAASVDKSLLQEPFDAILEFEMLDAIENKQAFLFKHNIPELCTAVKPFYAEWIMNRYNADCVIYLDPDIGVFDSLAPLSEHLEQRSILLTPHQLTREHHDLYVRENEILFLKRGSFNLGFFGVKNDPQGREFLHWWQDRTFSYCFDDDLEVQPELTRDGLLGLFTDQKWIDLVPSFFDNHYILRDPGYNVCTWNLSNRHVEVDGKGQYTVNGFPLRFFHFSGYDSGGHKNELAKSLQYYPHNKDVLALSNWYGQQLRHEDQEFFGKIPYSQTRYENGEAIMNFERKIYHIRKDVHGLFCKPFAVNSTEPCFYHWVRKEYAEYFDKENARPNQMDLATATTVNRFLPRGSKRRAMVAFIAKYLFSRNAQKKEIAPVQAEAMPVQAQAKPVKRTLTKYIRGEGIEIGALHKPLDITGLEVTKISYVDRMTNAELRLQYPELNECPLVNIDIVADGSRLETVNNSSLDFIIANHLIEHLENPIQALDNWLSKLKFGGIIYLAVPDKRHTFNHDRPLTPIEHLMEDYQATKAKLKKRNHAHYLEMVEFTDKLTGMDAEARMQDLVAKNYSIHFHTWTFDSFKDLLDHLISKMNMPFQIIDHEKTDIVASEFIFILKKNEP